MNNALLEKPIGSALVFMAAPTAIGMLLTFLFQLVDTYFIGQLGVQSLTAISFTYPVYILIVGFFMGIAAGLSAVVGKLIGEKETSRAAYLIVLSLCLFAVISGGVGVSGYLMGSTLFEVLGMPPHLYSLVSEYINPLFFGMPLLSIVLIANASLMAKGVLVKPMVVMAIGGVTNLILDYLLIFGMGSVPAMGLFGAALATVLSWAAMLFMMLVLLNKESLLPSKQIPVPSKTALKEDLLSVFTLSTPAIAAQVLTPISVAVITRLVSDHGEHAVAAYGIVTRIESLALTGILALSVIVTPLVAQNYGAYRQGNLSFLRLDNVIALSGRMTVYWGATCYLVLALVGEHFIALFTSNTDIIRIGYQYLLIVGLSFPAFGLVLITASFFNGVQLPSLSLKLTLVKSLLLTLPLAAIGAYFSASWIWASLALANVLGAVYAGKLLYRWLAEQETSLTEANASIMGDYLSDLKLLGRKLSRQKSV